VTTVDETRTDRRALLRDGAAALGTAALGAGALSALAKAASAPAGRKPNILLVMTDQERHRDRLPDHLPLPVRDWLDRNGTNMDRYHASSMACTPSRGCMWTGMHAPQQGMYGTFVVGLQFTMDPSIPTIGDLLRQLGYTSAFFGKWHLSYPGEPPTDLEAAVNLAELNPLKGYGFDYSAISPPADLSPAYNDGYTNDPIWTGQAVSWLREHAKDEKPWFCVLSLLNPHDIQFYPKNFRVDFKRPDYDAKPEPSFYAEPTLADKPSGQERFRQVVRLISGGGADADQHPEEYFRGLLNTYYDLIVGTDEMLGAAIKEVIDAGVLDDTVIIRTADHGELGSAHRMQNKGTTIYDEQNRVPFTVVYPKRFKRGARSMALGEHVDLVPTVLELAGEAKPTERWPWLRGHSLVGALENPDSRGPRDHVLYRIDEFAITGVGREVPTKTHIRSIFDGRYKFARYVAVRNGWFAGPELPGQEFELYDTWEDPYEIRNLANDPGYEKLRDEMLAWLLEREKIKYRPVELPAFGPKAPITKLPEIPTVAITKGGLPSPFVIPKPGSYLVVPIKQPNPMRFLYEGGLPQSIGGSSTDPKRAADIARFFCELAPGITP
jgi:arylsulfatase